MPSFKDKLKNMAAEKQIAVHPRVEKLNANLNTRSSYWLAFALYAKVEEKELDNQLIDLGKSLKLDDDEIKDELAAVKACESDEDFESLVRECAGGLADRDSKILLFAELNRFGKKNKMSLDFLPDMMAVLEVPDPAKDFIGEFNEIVNSSEPDLLSFFNLTNKFQDIPVFIYETFAPELWAKLNQDRTPEASQLLQAVSEKSFDEEDWRTFFLWLDKLEPALSPMYKKCKSFSELQALLSKWVGNFPQVIFFADQSEMQKTYISIETAFTESHSSVPLPLVKKYAFLQYKGKLQALFSTLKENISVAEPGYAGPSRLAAAEIGEVLFLRWYMRFSAGIKEQAFDESYQFWKIDRCTRDEDKLEENRRLATKELESIIAVYEEENRTFAEVFC